MTSNYASKQNLHFHPISQLLHMINIFIAQNQQRFLC